MLSLSNAIIQEDLRLVKQCLRYGEEVNALDEYGFTPLIEAAIVDNIDIAKILLENGADPNLQDVTGSTALHWAVENHDLGLAELLLAHQADPNAYTLAGQSVAVMPTLRRQIDTKKLLIQYNVDMTFTQDFINAKLLGHLFELIGMAKIVDSKNNYVDVDFEGYFLEITLGLISESLSQFQNHFAARQLQRYASVSHWIVEALDHAAELVKYQQYRTNLQLHQSRILSLINKDPLIIPVGYEGHAITFIKFGEIFAKCDRREDSRLFDNIVLYRIGNPKKMNEALLMHLLYQKQSHEFINHELPQLLALTPITEIKVDAQISGNCSWANVEAVIPTLFFLILLQYNQTEQATAYYKTLALNFFHRWREWNKDRALHFCMQSFQQADAIRKATKAEILAAIAFQRSHLRDSADRVRIGSILAVLLNSPYQYLLNNYIKVYYYDNPTPEGKQFFDLLKLHGYEAR